MSRKILIAEDEKDVIDMMRVVLEARGYDVVAAYDGLGALDLAKKESPDLIITDLLMPGITGLELCRRLRSDEDLCETPIIVITSVTQDSDMADGFWRIATDSDDFVTKPFDPYDLADRAERLIGKGENEKGSPE
jgi:two-component system alkaline phosphatase synthesis response regulator PhoP